MKNLFFALYSLCLAGLFSFSAIAADTNAQQQAMSGPAQMGKGHYYQVTYRVSVPVQWVTHVTKRVNVPYSQNSQTGTSNAGVAQDLKQFSDQTQKQMAEFSKL